MGSEDRSSFGREDLFLLMESYKNTVEPLTLLLEQNRHEMEKLDRITTVMETVAHKLDDCVNEIRKAHITWSTKINDYQSAMSKDHESIKGRINLVYVGMGTIIIGLLGLVGKLLLL